MKNVSKAKLRPPVKWHGGKYYLADRIISYFPAHRIYLEPFGGAASILLNKIPVDVEAYNDLDLRITRLFRVLQSQGHEFVSRIRFVPYSQKEFEDSAKYPAMRSISIKPSVILSDGVSLLGEKEKLGVIQRLEHGEVWQVM